MTEYKKENFETETVNFKSYLKNIGNIKSTKMQINA